MRREVRAAYLDVGGDLDAGLEDDVETILGIAKRGDALEFAPKLGGLGAHERDGLHEGVGSVVPGAASAAALDALPVVAADVVLPPHAHVEHRADARVFERHLRKAEVRREEPGRVWEQLAARLERRGLEHRRGVVRRRERCLHHGPNVAVQRGERGLGVVKRWKRDVDQVDLGIV